ncbi:MULTISPECIES: hypothetical protein [Streptomycetaceae]|uniref:Acyl-CoA dehydrogenase n=1 Tax=Streptantibioticus cattleyicolor (strain ATCC 35852 / DSM 46488 / JCM 4925 / NBRC 14057 / NRRL 8057) TaxID=1003195 RepID=F8JRC9_STREN|nr:MULTISPECIES: hypothetical protein [Streptomycetaceae]AEW96629.1 hypothetical protein SCATT_42580 [Streptantibioticus cattleyicolor NRRL 8057 = DSM 46488]MYS61122.1 hypothetical protein [Streptomyces sp. SID5468]CCB76967.1 protein of unknown function [Streptantibioticus cattleyicolor NRRL 8057 = DSM 46488]
MASAETRYADPTALHGFARALDACHDAAAPGALVASGDGWVIASTARLPGGVPVPGGAGAAVAMAGGAPAAPAEVLEAFADGLVRLHREAVRGVLDAAVARLDQRRSEGANLLNRQLVQGAVADVALVLSEAEDLLALADPTAGRRRHVHRRLVTAGRAALQLHGASGFVATGPGSLLHLTELLGNTYLHPGER